VTVAAEAGSSTAPAGTTTPPVVPVRHRWRTVAAVAVGVAVVLAVQAAARNHNFQWSVVFKYLVDGRILAGLRTTIVLTAATMAGASALGLVLAVMRQSESRLLSGLSTVYLWLFRGVPLLVQLLIWFNFSALFPRVPFGGPVLASVATNSVISPWVAALLALILNEAAYMAEIIRAGLLSVDRGQHEAAQALGMHRGLALRRIVIPQALRVILPPTGNETINMLKYTTLVSVIGFSDLLYSGQLIYGQTFETIPILITVSIWYLVVVSLLTVAQGALERRINNRYGPARGSRTQRHA